MNATTLPPPTKRATLDDLMKHDGKAELIGGKVVALMPAGFRHSRIGTRICIALMPLEDTIANGFAMDDNVAYGVSELLSRRESFSPDASFFVGPLSENQEGPILGPPIFAVEVRSPDDYGPKAERELQDKREDYFEAGTLAVWDVNPKLGLVTLHRPNAKSVIFRRGEIAHAEPAIPGWSMTVDGIFDKAASQQE